MVAHTVGKIAKNEEYFVVKLDNGGVRFGMYDTVSIDFPYDHPYYDRCVALLKAKNFDDRADELFDDLYSDGFIKVGSGFMK